MYFAHLLSDISLRVFFVAAERSVAEKKNGPCLQSLRSGDFRRGVEIAMIFLTLWSTVFYFLMKRFHTILRRINGHSRPNSLKDLTNQIEVYNSSMYFRSFFVSLRKF